MSKPFDIDALVDDLTPVRPVKASQLLFVLAILLPLLIAAIIAVLGPRADLAQGVVSLMFLWRAGTLFILGCATAHAVVAMASPSVGRGRHGWVWSMAGAALFPLSAIILAMQGQGGMEVFGRVRPGIECLTMTGIGALAVAVPMVLHLRKGAPTAPERAGWLTGIAAGAMGAFAYNFHCPYSDPTYVAVWYGGAVALSAAIGRLVVPPLIRW